MPQILNLLRSSASKNNGKSKNLAVILKQSSFPFLQLSSLGGGLKIEHKNHHFKFHYTKGPAKYLRCVRTGCEARVLVHQNRVYEVIAHHSHEDEAKVADAYSKY
jgi:hypothetical protein